MTINQRLDLLRGKPGELLSFGSGVALNMELGIDLIHILLDTSLGEIEPFRDLTVGEPLPHQLHDLVFPRRQRVKDRRTGACRVSRFAASPSAMICAARRDCVSRASRGLI